MDTDKMRLEQEEAEKRLQIEVPSIDRQVYVALISACALGIGGLVVLVHGYMMIGDDTLPVTPNEVGDYIGGVTGSLWALAGVLLIYVAFLAQRKQILLQQVELSATRLEVHGQRMEMKRQNAHLKRQRFENTFFQLLQLHNEIVKGIDTEVSTMFLRGQEATRYPVQGRDCFLRFYGSLRSIYERHLYSRKVAIFESSDEFKTNRHLYIVEDSEFGQDGNPTEDHRKACDGIVAFTSAQQMLEFINECYVEFYGQHGNDVGHYFRNLYHVFRFIHTGSGNHRNINPMFYARLVRAQLSSPELLLLFYNCLSVYGVNFVPYLSTYSILHNMNLDELVDPDHKHLYPPSVYGDDRVSPTLRLPNHDSLQDGRCDPWTTMSH